MPGLFHGTDLERPVTCAHCGSPVADCECARNSAGEVVPPQAQHPRVRREKRRGKWCTVIAGLEAPAGAAHKELLKALRTSLGTGGGLASGPAGPEIMLQGDHRDAVVEHLKKLGYQAKAAGG